MSGLRNAALDAAAKTLDTTCWRSLDNRSCACCADRPDEYDIVAAIANDPDVSAGIERVVRQVMTEYPTYGPHSIADAICRALGGTE